MKRCKISARMRMRERKIEKSNNFFEPFFRRLPLFPFSPPSKLPTLVPHPTAHRRKIPSGSRATFAISPTVQSLGTLDGLFQNFGADT